MNLYFAHISEDGRKQTVKEHLIGTAKLAAGFADEFNSGEFGYLAGMAHDIGKYSESFQRRLEGGPIVDHSTAGALECSAMGQELIGLCIAGHHGGIPDFGNMIVDQPGDDTFVGRLKKYFPKRGQAYPGWNEELPQTSSEPIFVGEEFARSMWIRMVYSCLVDADFLDTEAFMKQGDIGRGFYDGISTLCKRLSDYIDRWNHPKSEINILRNEIRFDCIKAAQCEKGLFNLTVPTGGGKTISSLAFALEHAKKHGMKRVIYVIPYTSIIEQTAEVFRTILGDNNVIEHHSEADYLYDEELTELQKRTALAAENWDAPIIVTTAVQFFESLFANSPSKCRKLHNIANSVIIFDEVQSVPTCHIKPCVAVIGTLVSHFGVSAVMCSATQPYVTDILKLYAKGFPVRGICKNTKELFEQLKRVHYCFKSQMTLERLADYINKEKQVLCIVNTRKTAKKLFKLIENEDTFHLSTLMMPEHRKQTLHEIRRLLNNGKPCKVISTSLIEAGVDIDFPSVFRELTGLDSVVQAAGRCNREGKLDANDSIVTVFELSEHIPTMLKINIGAAKETILSYNDIGSVEALDGYFKSYRSLIGNANIDISNVINHLCEGISGCHLPFKTVAKQFHLINQNMKTVYIPTRNNSGLIYKLRNGIANRNTYRQAGKYAVNIYDYHYNELFDAGDIAEICPGEAVLINERQYDYKTGLSLSAEDGKAEFI